MSERERGRDTGRSAVGASGGVCVCGGGSCVCVCVGGGRCGGV